MSDDRNPAFVVFIAKAIGETTTVLMRFQDYVTHPNRHPGGTNDTSKELAAYRANLAKIATEQLQHLLPDALAKLEQGQIDASAIFVIEAQRVLLGALTVLLPLTACETLRVDQEAAARNADEEASRRSLNAAKGARKPTFTDEELIQFREAYQLKHMKLRGANKAAALHFGVTDTAIGSRLKKIRTG